MHERFVLANGTVKTVPYEDIDEVIDKHNSAFRFKAIDKHNSAFRFKDIDSAKVRFAFCRERS